MLDIVYLAIVLGFFVLGAAYIRACAAIVGRDPLVEAEPVDPDEESEPGQGVVEVVR